MDVFTVVAIVQYGYEVHAMVRTFETKELAEAFEEAVQKELTTTKPDQIFFLTNLGKVHTEVSEEVVIKALDQQVTISLHI